MLNEDDAGEKGDRTGEKRELLRERRARMYLQSLTWVYGELDLVEGEYRCRLTR